MLIGVSVLPSISGNIKTINKIVYEDATNDRIEDIYGLKYDDRGYFINNQLVREEVSLVNTYNNGPGEIDPIWVTSEDLVSFYSMKAYEDYIYVSGSKYIPEEESRVGLLAKFNITNGELLWTKTWEGPFLYTNTWGLDIYNDSIYVAGWSGPWGIPWIDSFIRKYDLNGNLLWSKLINETIHDLINGVKVYDNYIYLSGYRDTYEGIAAWILKYDTNGNKIWSKTYRIQESATSIYDLEIYNGYIYAEGQTATYDENGQDVLVVKISLDGELIWFREWGGKGNQLGTGIDMEGGYIYVCSYDNLLKYDTEGKLQWDAESGTPGKQLSLVDVKVFNGSIYTTGEIWGLYPYEPYGDVVLQKYDINGKLIWYLTYGENYIDKGRCIETYNNSFYLCGTSSDKAFILNYDVDLFSDNNKPDTPSKPSGQVNGIPGVEYDYNTSTTDPDGDQIFYLFDWDDGTDTGWIETGEASHKWTKKGSYEIKVKAKDIHDFESDWSNPLKITISKSRAFNFDFNLLSWLFEHFPYLFPILQKILLLHRLGLQ